MRCPGCEQNVMPAEVSVEMSAEEDGFEVNFTCPSCEVDFFAVLGSTDFLPVD